MVKLTKIDGAEIYINAEEIESVESAFNSTITLRSSRKIVVKESAEEIKEKVIEYKRQIFLKNNAE
ncbi:MAG: flagellar FlbD family protein [Candidatus Kapaibacteriota bacterium]